MKVFRQTVSSSSLPWYPACSSDVIGQYVVANNGCTDVVSTVERGRWTTSAGGWQREDLVASATADLSDHACIVYYVSSLSHATGATFPAVTYSYVQQPTRVTVASLSNQHLTQQPSTISSATPLRHLNTVVQPLTLSDFDSSAHNSPAVSTK